MPNRSSRAWPRDVCGVPDLDDSMRAGEAGVHVSTNVLGCVTIQQAL